MAEVEEIIRKAIGEKISLPPEELQELIDEVKEHIKSIPNSSFIRMVKR